MFFGDRSQVPGDYQQRAEDEGRTKGEGVRMKGNRSKAGIS